MIRELNLLPLERRRLLKTQTSLRAVRTLVQTVVLSLFVLTLGGVVAAAVFWGLLLTYSQSDTVNLEQALEEYQEERERVARSNLVLKTMAELGEERVVWSELLPDLFDAMPPGVVINDLDGEIAQSVQLSVSGRAANRSVLTVTEARLKKLPWVSVVDAPRSNLIERLNPNFTFHLLLSETKEEVQ